MFDILKINSFAHSKILSQSTPYPKKIIK